MALDFSELKNQCERLLRAGHTQIVQKMFQELQPAKIPRVHAADIANLARRAGLNNLSLKILSPIVRTQRKRARAATDTEKLSYAVSLLRVGSVVEARALLSEVGSDIHEKCLYLGFADVTEWNY